MSKELELIEMNWERLLEGEDMEVEESYYKLWEDDRF